MSQKSFAAIANVGETLMLLGAAAWIQWPVQAGWVLAVGTVLFAVGRMAGPSGDYASSNNQELDFRLRRLYRQRMAGAVLAVLAAIIINLPSGFYWGYFVSRTMWLIPFTAFVVIELFTAFRIPAVERQIQH